MADLEANVITQSYRSRQALVHDQIKCRSCGQQFSIGDNVVAMPNVTPREGSHDYFHYPTCPPLPPPIKGLAPGMPYNVQEGWE